MKNLNQTKEEKLKQRKIRNGKYVYEDYLESINKTKIIGYVCLLFGAFYLLSTLFLGGTSLPHSIVSILIGLFILVGQRIVSYEESSVVILIACGYIFFTLMEYFLFGLPNRLIPGLGEFRDRKLVNIITLANDVSPLIYFGVKFTMSYLLFKVIFMDRKVKELSKDVKDAIGIRNK